MQAPLSWPAQESAFPHALRAAPAPWAGRAMLAGVCVLAALAYLPGLAGPFQFDDYVTVATDPGARSFPAWWDRLGTHVRPVLKASFVLTGALGSLVGDVPTGHRLGNLAIHLAATLAFFAFGSRVAGLLEPWHPPARRRAHALTAAAAFALHPLATEAVSYLSARSAALAALAAVLALLCWLDAREAHGGRRLAGIAGGLLAWAIACGSREVAALTPAMLVLVEALRERPAGEALSRRRVLAFLALAAGLGALAFATWLARHPAYGALLDLSARIAGARLQEPAMATALHYLGCVAALACAPSIDPAPVPATWPQAGVLVLAMLAVAALSIRARRRQPMLLVALAWAALWLLPSYALPIRHDVVSERHAYAALWSLGWIGAAVAMPLVTAPARGIRFAGLALVAALLAVLALLAAQRNAQYRSEESLWEAAVREGAVPRLRALNNLGAAYVEAGRWEEAERVLRQAGALDPDNAIVEHNLDRALRRSPH